jgi:hypothetical protein
MEIEFTVPFRRQLAPWTLSVELVPEPLGRPPQSPGFWRWRTS